MTRVMKDILYRICGLAEASYWRTYERNKDRPSRIYKGDPNDSEWCSDEWTMDEKDYEMVLYLEKLFENYTKISEGVDFLLDRVNEKNPNLPRYMSFRDFVYENHAEIWDNCKLHGNWISWYDTSDDKVTLRITKKEPIVYKKGRLVSNIKDPEDYEDVCVDRRNVLFKEPWMKVNNMTIYVDDFFWNFGQTFSND